MVAVVNVRLFPFYRCFITLWRFRRRRHLSVDARGRHETFLIQLGRMRSGQLAE
jgi:hypothetical protein